MKTKLEEKRGRAKKANALIAFIASCGRKFFNHSGKISHMEVDDRGRIWFINAYNGKRIYTHYTQGRWRGFGEGGTLRDLIIRLRDYICTGKNIGKALAYPDWYSNSDPWGYNEDMEKVYKKALELGIVAE